MPTQVPGDRRQKASSCRANEGSIRRSSRGHLVIAGCSSGTHLAGQVAQQCLENLSSAGFARHPTHLANIDYRFENSETCIRLGAEVEGADAYVIQALCDPASDQSADDNYIALLAAGRAMREYGAAHVTAVIPYLAYGRQDKPSEGEREPVTARLMADLTVAAGYDRVMTWHPHCGQLRGFYGGLPVHFLDPLPYFQEVFAAFAGRDDSIVVAPDAGAAKLAIRVANNLDLRFAVGAKHRPARDTVEMGEIAGDFRRVHTALVVEDELGTGGTAAGLVARLFEKIGVQEIRLAVSHNRCLDSAEDRLRSLNRNQGLAELVVTDSIPQTRAFRDLEFLRVHSLAEPVSAAITNIHMGAGLR